MFKWISEVFASNADKARLIAILVSATVAIAALLLNQYFAKRRARKDLLIGKVEELFNSLNDYHNYGKHFLMSNLFKNKNPDDDDNDLDSLNKAVESAQKCGMLANLYFDDFEFSSENAHEFLTELANKTVEMTHDKEGLEVLAVAAATEKIFNERLNSLKDRCVELAKRYRH